MKYRLYHHPFVIYVDKSVIQVSTLANELRKIQKKICRTRKQLENEYKKRFHTKFNAKNCV